MTDDFTLADLKLDYAFGPATLTSITSYTHRNVLVLRDATQLSGSVTFDVFGQQRIRLIRPGCAPTRRCMTARIST